jgi:predicted RNA-binding protein YlqC (UPF0109 family)
MGHKVHPYGFRIGVIKPWLAKWYADRDYAGLLQEDMQIRQLVDRQLSNASVSQVEIERGINHVTVTVHSAKPGIVIGKGGANVEALRTAIGKLTNKKVKLEIKEILQPELDGVLVAQNVAGQLERRIAEGREDSGLRPARRLRDEPNRMGSRGSHSARYPARRHQLRRRPRAHHVRPDRRQGLDLPGRAAGRPTGQCPHGAARAA